MKFKLPSKNQPKVQSTELINEFVEELNKNSYIQELGGVFESEHILSHIDQKGRIEIVNTPIVYKIYNSEICNITLIPKGKGIEIYRIEVYKTGNGIGSKIMEIFNTVSCELDIPIYLTPGTPGSFTDNGEEKRREKFYRSVNFRCVQVDPFKVYSNKAFIDAYYENVVA